RGRTEAFRGCLLNRFLERGSSACIGGSGRIASGGSGITRRGGTRVSWCSRINGGGTRHRGDVTTSWGGGLLEGRVPSAGASVGRRAGIGRKDQIADCEQREGDNDAVEPARAVALTGVDRTVAVLVIKVVAIRGSHGNSLLV